MNKILLPLIRKVHPTLVAADIIGVQPMHEMRLTYEVVKDIVKPIPENHVIVFVNMDISNWIEQQPVHMWKFYDLDNNSTKWKVKSHYIISDELLTLLTLKWS